MKFIDMKIKINWLVSGKLKLLKMGDFKIKRIREKRKIFSLYTI